MARRFEPQPALGRAIRHLRLARDLTQRQLARQADVHPTWLSHLEAGRVNPSWGTVRRIAVALNLRVSELAAEAEHPRFTGPP